MSGARKSGRRTIPSKACVGEMKTPSARLKNESAGGCSGTEGAIIDSPMLCSFGWSEVVRVV
jgi:hypothetical protein